MSEAQAKKRFRLSRTLVLTGWVLQLILIVGLVGGAIYLQAIGQPSDKVERWAEMAIVFMFGTFATMVRDFLKEGDEP